MDLNRTPNLLIAGAARSGTTLLALSLAQHPEVELSQPKEPHFLSLGSRPLDFQGPGDNETINARSVTDHSKWLDLWSTARPTKVRCDASATGLVYSADFLRRREEYCEGSTVIVLLRDPINRAYSAYNYQRSRGYESEPTFGAALEKEAERFRMKFQHIWWYLRSSNYFDDYSAFVSNIPPSNLLTYSYETLAERSWRLTEQISKHFELEAPLAIETARVNSSGEPRSKTLNRLKHVVARVPAARSAYHSLPWRTREALRAASLREQLALDISTLREHVLERFAPLYSRDLREVLEAQDVDVSTWHWELGEG